MYRNQLDYDGDNCLDWGGFVGCYKIPIQIDVPVSSLYNVLDYNSDGYISFVYNGYKVFPEPSFPELYGPF